MRTQLSRLKGRMAYGYQSVLLHRMPRQSRLASPPTATGLPLRRVSEACSTRSKKGIGVQMNHLALHTSFTHHGIFREDIRSLKLLAILSNQGDHDALNHQFVSRNQVRILGVFGFEEKDYLSASQASS